MSLIEVFTVAAVVLVAILVGTAIPALLQLRATLKSLATFLDETRPKVDAVLDQATEATSRINRAAGAVEEGIEQIRGALDAVGSLAHTLDHARESVRKAAAVLGGIVPAMAAGIRVFFSSENAGPPPPTECEGAEAPEGDGP